MPYLRDMKYVLKALATSKQKSNFVHSLNRLRIISEQIHRNISMQHFFVKSGHACFIFAMESMLLNQDGRQWLAIRQGFILNDCIKGLLTLKRIRNKNFFCQEDCNNNYLISIHCNVHQGHPTTVFLPQHTLKTLFRLSRVLFDGRYEICTVRSS